MNKVQLLGLIDDYARHRALSETFKTFDDMEISDFYREKSRDEFRLISDILLNDYLEE